MRNPELEKLKMKIKKLEEERDILVRSNIYYHEENIRLSTENQELKNRFETKDFGDHHDGTAEKYYEKRCRDLEERIMRMSSGLDVQSLVPFLYTGIYSEQELISRHKKLQALFHPDNFEGGEEVFKGVQNYYECMRYQFRK